MTCECPTCNETEGKDYVFREGAEPVFLCEKHYTEILIKLN